MAGKTLKSARRSATAVMLIGAAIAMAIASPALAERNNGSGGGRSMNDILHDGYHCIAQNPKNGMIWCVRGTDEGGYLCTPEGWCSPVPPSPVPPWRLSKAPRGLILHPPTRIAPAIR